MTTQQSDAERVRDYLLTQANKLTITELVDKVRRDAAPLKTVAASLPQERFDERPAAEDWSAAEVFAHILEMTETGASAIEGIIDRGAIPPRILDEMTAGGLPELSDAEDYWQMYESRREQLYARVLRAAGDEHLDIKIPHPVFGQLSWREWLLFMRVHDLDHLRQLQAIVSALNGA